VFLGENLMNTESSPCIDKSQKEYAPSEKSAAPFSSTETGVDDQSRVTALPKQGEVPSAQPSNNINPHRLLVVDDNVTILEVFRKILINENDDSSEMLDALEASLFDQPTPQKNTTPQRFTVDCLQDGETACQKATIACSDGQSYSVAFVDMRMPGGWDGLQTIQKLWEVDPQMHIVICTAFSDYSWDEITEKLGLSDQLLILRKPFEKIEVLQLATALSQKWMLHRKQQTAMEDLELRVIERTQELTVALAEREAYASQLQHQATHDVLTGLPNRDLLRDRLKQAITHAARYGHSVWVAFLDLDHFKLINDTYGHETGDILLYTMSERLRTALRETDTVARIGGDEFILVLTEHEGESLSAKIVKRIMEIISQPVILETKSFNFTCSMGVAVYPTDGEDPEILMKNADIAMYRAKETGRNNFHFFTPSMNFRLLARMQLEHSLRTAIEKQEFALHYQPQIDLHTGRIIGMEALIRWNNPDTGIVYPHRFIEMAEDCGLIGLIGTWVLRTACAQNKAWQLAGIPPIHVAVHLSSHQLVDNGLVDSIATILKETGLDPSFLELEITESAVVDGAEKSLNVLHKLKELGVKLSVDNFGTGYSNLSCLKQFPLDTLKIDQSFVHEIGSNEESAGIIASIISLAHNLRLHVIAEGVETQTQLAYLKQHNCDFIQGYRFSHPLPAVDFEQLLREGRSFSIDASTNS
jgi:diguanylate cyclase (GGDEF)-like protein